MAYFSAAFARAGFTWRTSAVEVDGAEDLAALADLLRASAVDDDTVLLLLEHEDEWFAVVRVDSDDDPRVFVSDSEGVTHSPFAGVLFTDVDPVDDEDAPPGLTAAGDPDLLADLGMPGEALLDLCGEDGVLPTEATDGIARAAGFADLLDAMR